MIKVSGEEWLQWGVFAQMAAMAAWDFDSWAALSARECRARPRLGCLAPLTIALNLLDAIGAAAFAERARRELLATGEKVRKREVDTYSQVTSQEEHIIRLARDGRGNREIAAELFISTRTVEWHFLKVFAKLGITSRRDLPNAVPP